RARDALSRRGRRSARSPAPPCAARAGSGGCLAEARAGRSPPAFRRDAGRATRAGSARPPRPRAAVRTDSPGRCRNPLPAAAPAPGRDRERLAELDERAQQRLAFGVLSELGEERAVDLQRVDGEALQVRERGVAGAEVIDRDA